MGLYHIGGLTALLSIVATLPVFATGHGNVASLTVVVNFSKLSRSGLFNTPQAPGAQTRPPVGGFFPETFSDWMRADITPCLPLMTL